MLKSTGVKIADILSSHPKPRTSGPSDSRGTQALKSCNRRAPGVHQGATCSPFVWSPPQPNSHCPPTEKARAPGVHQREGSRGNEGARRVAALRVKPLRCNGFSWWGGSGSNRRRPDYESGRYHDGEPSSLGPSSVPSRIAAGVRHRPRRLGRLRVIRSGWAMAFWTLPRLT